MRTVFLCGYPIGNTRFGVSEHVYQLSKALGEIGIKIFVVSFYSQTKFQKINKNVYLIGLKKHFFYYLFPFFAVINLNKLVRKIQPNVIHMHCITFPYMFSYLTIKNYKKVLTIHGNINFEFEQKKILSKIFRKIFILSSVKKIYATSDIIISCSNYIKKSLECDQNKVEVIPNGVFLSPDLDLERGNNKKGTNLLYIGSLSFIKGVDILLNAMRKASDLGYELKLNIIGKGDEQQKLEKLALSLDLQNVYFKGYLRGAKKEELIKNSDILIIPSRFDNFPIVMLEAMAKNLPIIASRVGGIPEVVIDNFNGLLFETENTNDLVLKIITLVKNEKLRNKFASRNINLIKKYQWKEIAKKTCNLYFN